MTVTPRELRPDPPGDTRLDLPPGTCGDRPSVPGRDCAGDEEPEHGKPVHQRGLPGGSGQDIVSKITVTVSRSDGQVIQKTIPPSGQEQYAVGDMVTIPGTPGADEVAVVATILGVDYKIYDQSLGLSPNP